MGTPLTNNFKKLFNNQKPDKAFFVPMLRWCSAYRPNIEMCQRINRNFYKGNQDVLISELALNNKLTKFIAYPKAYKDDKKLDFFFNGLCKFYGWTRLELEKNLHILDINSLKEIIAKTYGYTNIERKIIGLKKIEIK